MRFLNAELKRCKKPTIDPDRAFCTLVFARRKFPGSPASLDALCRRFEIDNSHRVKHGALLDTELLAEVYVELLGGKQRGLNLSALDAEEANTRPLSPLSAPDRPARPPRPHAASAEELARHAAFVAKLKNPIWLTLAEVPEAATAPKGQ
jgi:DNA polymerase-3 subunit epsilon